MTTIKDGRWYVLRTIDGYAVQWRLSPGAFATFSPDQYGRVRHMSHPAGGCANPSLFDEVRQSAIKIHNGTEMFRYGNKFSDAREKLCVQIADDLNVRGVCPQKQLTSCQRPEGER
jgi:hypothetical protein